MDLFHGSDKATTKKLENGQIRVDLGGGELGRGFYCGDWQYRAKAWAERRFGNPSVLKIVVDDDDFLGLDPLLLNKSEAIAHRQEIKNAGKTRSFEFKVSAVWAPVVGIPSSDFNQVKWESKKTEPYLNGSKVKRRIV
jgi:hypothetical protein